MYILLIVAALQIQIGTVRGIVSDPAGARVASAQVDLMTPLAGLSQTLETNSEGEFDFQRLPFGTYVVRVNAPGFNPHSQTLIVESNIPYVVQAALSLAGSAEALTVLSEPGLVRPESASSEIDLTPPATSRPLQSLIATTPGWSTEQNGLLHVRGVDDGILYVVDGIPTLDRVDTVSGTSYDADMIRSLRIISGHIPAEFGGRSGAVIAIHPKSGLDLPRWKAGLDSFGGNFRTREAASWFAGNVNRKLGFFGRSTLTGSDRYLDPVDLDNFNNRGGALRNNARVDWQPAPADLLIFNASVNGSNFRVPNTLEQETAGQRQRQHLRDRSASAGWEHVWSANSVTNFAFFHRAHQSELFGSENDTPIAAAQFRRNARQGLIASWSGSEGGHNVKLGTELHRISVREFFSFAVTDAEHAEEQHVSSRALEFTPNNPFIFRQRRAGSQFSWFVQDAFSPRRNLTLNVGVRYERSPLPAVEHQLSPRAGIVYYVPSTTTAIRASYNRLYMPPQLENLLLASSEQARQLSPFMDEGEGGGATVRPERVSAYEVGFAQDVAGLFRLDAAHWWRTFRDFDDPNVFFNTTIIFPNSVASGFARGVDVRVDVPERRGWSGYLSYTNSRILQTGPIVGGLFLTDEFAEIGPGTKFIPDHDQRNVGSFGVTYHHRRTGFQVSLSGRHESGIPLEIEEDALEDLRHEPGADLVNFERQRVKPWTVFDAAASIDLIQNDRISMELHFGVDNIANRRFAYNFGNPFEGTHFGHPRLIRSGLKLSFR